MRDFNPCVVIPTHNHAAALDGILSVLCSKHLPVIVVDDGSDFAIAAEIQAACAAHSVTECQRVTFNRGKGYAVTCGLARAHDLGYTHAIQVDADGQHDLAALDSLLQASRLNPDAIVTGIPRYDATIPRSRRFWRPLTTFWIWVNTVSTSIADGMCGFRAYPVAETLRIVRRSVRARRMDFDVEVLVKAYWAGVPVLNIPVAVTYPPGNFSNFDLVADNVRLSLTHARLFFGMLLRFPWLLVQHARAPAEAERSGSWADMQERGAYWGLLLLGVVYKVLGRTACLTLMFPVVLYFFLTGTRQRAASRDYLTRVWRSGYLARRPTTLTSLLHYMSFSSSLLDRLAAWSGNIRLTDLDPDSVAALDEVAASPRGAYVITAHIGSPEVVRAVATLSRRAVVNVLMHTDNAQRFNRLIQRFSPDAHVRVISASNIGPETAILLAEMISRGEWIVVAGDRMPPGERRPTINAMFLNDLAPFPTGPFILGSILKCPAYLLFGPRHGRSYRVHFSQFADPIELPRSQRATSISSYVSSFAKALEACVAEAPLQWFNFYLFWNELKADEPRHSIERRATQ